MTLLDGPAGQLLVDENREIDICAFDDLAADRGVCALVAGAPVALFRCSPDDELFAVGNLDPYSGASVLSRGIVGSIGDRPVIASPIFKNRFDLRNGESLDDPSVRIPVHATRVVEGRVLVSVRPLPAAAGDAGHGG
jgi:nitrite reductase (NADH) small subunit